jgi:hypothetical protein
MFGDDARTIVTFNGSPDQQGHQRLEVASLTPSGALEFRAVEMPAGDTGRGRARFTEANPDECMVCHGPTPHYIWSRYNNWPGAYGSQDDSVVVSGSEASDLKRFRAAAAGNPRYATLVHEFDDGSGTSPYRPPEHPGAQPYEYKLALEYRPNARLGMLLIRHQAEARVRSLMAAPRFAELKYGLAYMLAGCSSRLGSAQTGPLIEHNGLRDELAYARALGMEPLEAWHLDKGGSTESVRRFDAGLTTFQGVLQGHLWTLGGLSSEPRLAPYFIPARFADYVRDHDEYALADSPRGQELWDVLDREGAMPTRFLGSEEADSYMDRSGLPALTTAQLREACAALARAQLAAPR